MPLVAIPERVEPTIWTIGHSNRSAQDFLEILKAFKIEMLADIRRYPGSRKYSHFNSDTLKEQLDENNIQYLHIPELGGRRKPRSDSKNTSWRHSAFRGYADYMETDEFKNAVQQLQDIATKYRTAYMCSEAVWWSCHRALVSDFLKIQGWHVMHIMGITKATEHPYTSAAKIIDNQLVYTEPDLFS